MPLGSIGPNGPSPTPLLYAALIILIGGRAVPAFTRSWLDRTGEGSPSAIGGRSRTWRSRAFSSRPVFVALGRRRCQVSCCCFRALCCCGR